jgi:ParB-like chromosome segregation protein Spo0J
MTERRAYTTEQWQALVEAPPAIARAVASVAGSAGQTETELGAFLELVDQAASDAAGGLLGAIVGDVHGRLAGGLPPEPMSDAFMDGLEAARRAGAILSVQADPAEAARVRAWLLSVAQVVASAEREGAVLGIGGEQVSHREEQAIAAIRDALGVESDAP